AFDAGGGVRATLAQRDRIFGDDNIQFFLSTFNDGRQATFLAVNPLGVQADGAVNESGRVSCSGFNCSVGTREGPDLSQDFVWQSAGRLTDTGYEVEIVLPLKSIRFQSAAVQTWGINVLRVVQSRGQEQTWTPARLGQSSFLAQSGQLVGLEGLRTGRAVDVIPTVTSRVDGGPTSPGWDYHGGSPEFGGSLRWGVTPNLTLNATANPDFSQVESDVGQFAFDPRQALFFPERRPFFLDGVEQFQVPNNLIYTRRIVQPVAATKLTGKAFGTQVGVLAAVDERAVSRSGDNPLFGVLRLARDLGPGSQVGMVYTEQHDGDDLNRVAGIDGRVVLGRVHSVTFNGALAHDRIGGTGTTAPLWGLGYRYNGRAFRTRYSISGIDEAFRTRTGFITRPGIANARLSHSYTWLRPERALQSFTAELAVDGTWVYDSLVGGGDIQDRKLHLNLNSQWGGGWTIGASVLDESFGYDPTIYANYGVLQGDGTIAPFVGTPRIANLDYVLSIGSPQFALGSFNVFLLYGDDENFDEWASGRLFWLQTSATLRPNDNLRFTASYRHIQVNRPSDGSRVSLQMVPRLQAEYQLTRDLQVRLISQYALQARDSLRDDSRTGLPLVIRDPATGTYRRALEQRDGRLRSDLLLTYFPNPGTVIYLGYGASHAEPLEDGRRIFTRTNDGFFLKLSYLFRMTG
ncbi:MAG: hypothetical protein KC489_01430, partial [Gemmatimonadetes bacterium]|nr:hypothetical protein [Gemmatimonadota bacterium]